MLSKENQELISRPLICGAVGTAIDRFYFGRNDMRRNIAFGGAIASGVLFADVVGQHVIPNSHAKNLETRIMEVGLATGSVVVLDRYVFNQGSRPDMSRILSIVASEVLGDYVDGMIMNKNVL